MIFFAFFGVKDFYRAALKIQHKPSCEGFFRQTQQKPQGMLDVSPRIFVRYDGNKTRRFDCDEFFEVTYIDTG